MSQTEQAVKNDGTIASVSGPVVTARNLNARMNDVVYVGDEGLMGEVIEIEDDITTVQVYEETSGIAPREPVENTGEPLSVDLGPGLLDTIYDGVQRPLDVLEDKMGSPYLDRGVDAPGIELDRQWSFEPTIEEGTLVEAGDIIGTVDETVTIEHKVMVPPNSDGGEVVSIESGSFTVEETVAELDTGEEIQMRQEWPVREARPSVEKRRHGHHSSQGNEYLMASFQSPKVGRRPFRDPSGLERLSHNINLPSTLTQISSSMLAAASAGMK